MANKTIYSVHSMVCVKLFAFIFCMDYYKANSKQTTKTLFDNNYDCNHSLQKLLILNSGELYPSPISL